MPYVAATVAKDALHWQQYVFFTDIHLFAPYKTMWLTAISSHCLAALPITSLLENFRGTNFV